ncbi:MAG: PKD domain-containing protein [Armatimonadota bacterium]|nr:PKD domain-containing protein [Armatimonadota bacterium]
MIPRTSSRLFAILSIAAIAGLAGCGGGGGAGGGGTANGDPRISSVDALADAIWPSGTTTFTCEASDPDRDGLTYTWTATGGNIERNGKSVTYSAPESGGIFTIEVTVTDGNGGRASQELTITVGATVHGTVVDVEDKGPVEGATVNVGGASGTTDENGDFSIVGVGKGLHPLSLGGTWAVAGAAVNVNVRSPGETVQLPSPVQAINIGRGPPPPPEELLSAGCGHADLTRQYA